MVNHHSSVGWLFLPARFIHVHLIKGDAVFDTAPADFPVCWIGVDYSHVGIGSNGGRDSGAYDCDSNQWWE